ncbi:MAG: ABC transporter permease, partial [Burkholderiales bacterium]
MIKLEQVTKTFRNGELEVQVLHGIDLEIRGGEFVAIMGASGSGKSTLMNILGCLDRPSSGRYLFNGQDVSALGRDELARLRREAFGFVFQSYNLIPTASAARNVEVPAVYAGMPAAQRRARSEELLGMLGLSDRLGHRPNQLSGGQQQRVSIARALMNGGQIILADEPTGALDSKSGREVMALLHKLSAEGHTVIVITHAREVAEEAQRVIEIADGRIVKDPGPRRQGLPLKIPEKRNSSSLASLVEAGKAAGAALRANVFRTALTLLGIVIGVASVIAMLAVGNGAKQQVLDRISGMGTNLLLVRPGAPNQRGTGGIATLVPEDAEAIAALPNVLAAVPEQGGGATARFSGTDYQTQVNATGAEFTLARGWPVARGLFFSQEDVRSYAAVAVLGQTVAKTLFENSSPLGKHIVLDNTLFQVIGVMSERGASPMGSDQD